MLNKNCTCILNILAFSEELACVARARKCSSRKYAIVPRAVTAPFLACENS